MEAGPTTNALERKRERNNNKSPEFSRVFVTMFFETKRGIFLSSSSPPFSAAIISHESWVASLACLPLPSPPFSPSLS